MEIKDFQVACWGYSEKYLIPNLQSDVDRWLAYFGMGIGTFKFEDSLEQFIPIAQQVGIVSKEGQVDLDVLEKYGKVAFQKQKKVKIWKFIFNQNDFDDFLKYLRKTKKQPEE